MNDEDTRAMDQFGITEETKSVFYFQGHKYERLDDALKYAKQVGHVAAQPVDQPEQ